MEEIRICDTTLRDGEQMPGVVFTPEQKIKLAQKISDFGAHIIELMPSVSFQESKVTKTITSLGLDAEITASTMLRKQHIDLAASCGVDSVTLFTPVSDLHLETRLRKTREENLQASIEAIDYALDCGLKINFAGEDATRADTSYLLEFINTISPSIGYFLVCDTVGLHTPGKSYSFFRKIHKSTKCAIGLHGHNDFGLATANTLVGLEAGASVFSGTFCGIGERAGNVPIEEVVSALRFLYDKKLEVKYEALTDICRLVESFAEIPIQSHKPITGINAFSHESGIHVNGILKDPKTYEPFDPNLVGQERSIIFGKHSGKSYIRQKLGVSDAEAGKILEKVKAISQKEKRPLSLTDIRNIQKEVGK